MRRAQRMLGSALVLLLGLAVGLAEAQPQFSGTWVLDRAQSQLPQHPHHRRDASDRSGPPPEVRLIVEQEGNTLKATRSVARGTRERSMSETFVTDGSERSEPARGGGSAVTRATLGGDRLVISKTYTAPAKEQGQPPRTFSRESVWTLSPDGRTLTIDTTMQSDRGQRTMKHVFTKAT